MMCWLCGSSWSPSSPYSHFNKTTGSCTGKLFHGVDLVEYQRWWDDWLADNEAREEAGQIEGIVVNEGDLLVEVDEEMFEDAESDTDEERNSWW